MEKDARYFWVGLFVTFSLTALLAFVIWLAGASDMRSQERYTVYFTDAVSGLLEGAAVQYKGLAVGKVVEMRLAEGRSDLIKVDIEVDKNTPVRGETRANLAMQGITGLAYIELRTEPDDTTPVRKMANERHPVIIGSGTQIAKLFEDIPYITKQVLDLSKKLNAVLDDENMAKVSQTLANIEQMSRDMNGLLSNSNVANAGKALENMAAASEDMPELVSKLGNSADQMDKAVASLSRVITQNEANVNKFSRDGLDEITAMSRETRRMAVSIRRIAEKLDQDPSQLLYKPSYNGVEIKK